MDSFSGNITARLVEPGESFRRYTDVAQSKGSFLTKTLFDSPAAAVDGLYLGPYGNGATLVQNVTATARSIMLEGGIANGGAGIRQSLIVDRGAFSFESGQVFGSAAGAPVVGSSGRLSPPTSLPIGKPSLTWASRIA